MRQRQIRILKHSKLVNVILRNHERHALLILNRILHNFQVFQFFFRTPVALLQPDFLESNALQFQKADASSSLTTWRYSSPLQSKPTWKKSYDKYKFGNLKYVVQCAVALLCCYTVVLLFSVACHFSFSIFFLFVFKFSLFWFWPSMRGDRLKNLRKPTIIIQTHHVLKYKIGVHTFWEDCDNLDGGGCGRASYTTVVMFCNVTKCIWHTSQRRGTSLKSNAARFNCVCPKWNIAAEVIPIDAVKAGAAILFSQIVFDFGNVGMLEFIRMNEKR